MTGDELAPSVTSAAAASRFADLALFTAIPRVTGVAVAPDGERLIATVETPSPDGKRWLTALWAVDPSGAASARRLTRSAEGEASPAFLPNGDLLFVSRRPDPAVHEPREEAGSVWLLPARGGEAEAALTRRGGFAAVVTARDGEAVLLAADVLSGPAADDEERRKAREDAGVSAILHEEPEVRYWDQELGPGQARLLATAPPGSDGGFAEPRDLTPDAGRALWLLSESRAALSPDGATAVVPWWVPMEDGARRTALVAIDLASGARTILTSDPAADFDDPAVSPDGRWVACLRRPHESVDVVPDVTLWLAPLAGGDGRDLAPGWDRWPQAPAWAADGSALYVTADEAGHRPAFRVEVATGAVARLTASGAYSSLSPARDGSALYGVRSAVDAPPAPVRLQPQTEDQEPAVLPGPDERPARADARTGGRGQQSPDAAVPVPGRLEEVTVAAADGTPLRAWLVLPEGVEAPVPLLVWIHGGPLASWNGWHWRWCPWIAAARGYAVLLPDPALSTGYGQRMIERGWGQWGGAPYDDVIALTDAALERPDLDASRTAAMGGSYGGYLSNWVAGHTDRFRAIVTHASLWGLEAFAASTDVPWAWRREWGTPDEAPEFYERWSPDRHVAAIRTPMLVIHGDKDYRVPIGEALRLWTDLNRHGVEAKFLSFPTENHWILTPGNTRVWYETVFAFLAHHVLGEPWTRPALL